MRVPVLFGLRNKFESIFNLVNILFKTKNKFLLDFEQFEYHTKIMDLVIKTAVTCVQVLSTSMAR